MTSHIHQQLKTRNNDLGKEYAVQEAQLPATLKAHGSVGTTSVSGRASKGGAFSAVLSPNTQLGAPAAMSAKQDWLDIATADPAFWLKEVSS